MPQRVLLTPFFPIFAALYLGAGGVADEPDKSSKPSVNELSMEIAALQTLHVLKLERGQLEALRKMAGETSGKAGARQSPRASEKYQKALTDARAALVKGSDDERIDDLLKQVDDLRKAEKPELDDGIDVTEEARDRTSEALRLLKANQVAAFVGVYAEDIPDPLTRILEALDKVRGLNAAEWKELREVMGEEVGWLIAGIDLEETEKVSDRVIQLLIVARGLKDKEFKDQRPELEKKAREIVGDLGPTEVLRHFMEHTLAELLSNPLLETAIEARMKGS